MSSFVDLLVFPQNLEYEFSEDEKVCYVCIVVCVWFLSDSVVCVAIACGQRRQHMFSACGSSYFFFNVFAFVLLLSGRKVAVPHF